MLQNRYMITLGDAFNARKFGGAVRAARGDASLRAFAERLGTSASTISRTERYGRPDLDLFIRVCYELGLDANDYIKENVDAPMHDDDWMLSTMIHGMLKPDAAEVVMAIIRILEKDSR